MDTVLAPDVEPPFGAHLMTRRCGYIHHGIYVGTGRVVHYSAVAWSLIGRPVEEVSLTRFCRGRTVWIRARAQDAYDPAEIVRRARSRLGEDQYRLLTNNCEHFCEWCTRGQHHSTQVEALRALLRVPLRRRNGSARAVHWSTPRVSPGSGGAVPEF
jgi:Lecithin retinol acyltransferase